MHVCPDEDCSPVVETLAFDDEVCEANLWLVERELRSGHAYSGFDGVKV